MLALGRGDPQGTGMEVGLRSTWARLQCVPALQDAMDQAVALSRWMEAKSNRTPPVRCGGRAAS